MRFLRVREVLLIVGFSKNTLYARIRAGTFPKPIALGPQTTAFLEGEVIEWMKAQVAQRRGYSRPTSGASAACGAKAVGSRNV
jgi:prophage regulatory protein